MKMFFYNTVPHNLILQEENRLINTFIHTHTNKAVRVMFLCKTWDSLFQAFSSFWSDHTPWLVVLASRKPNLTTKIILLIKINLKRKEK